MAQSTATPYKKREFYSCDEWEIADHRLKVYGIHIQGADPPDQETLNHARTYVESVMPEAAHSEGESARLGYCILHSGDAGTWLLAHWWAHHDICCQRMAHARRGTSDFKSADERPLHACVWEQVVIQHERDAWVRHMMSPVASPDDYLNNRLPDGLY